MRVDNKSGQDVMCSMKFAHVLYWIDTLSLI